MKTVQREDIVDYETFGEQRAAFQERVLQAKALRRIHVGEHLTFLFENALTVRWQIQEMLRVERIVREKDVRHEIDTYNELIGGEDELGATLLVEIDDAAERDRLLTAWLDLPDDLWLELDDGSRVPACVDERQRARGRLSAVQYLKFALRGRTPVAVVCDHEGARARTVLSRQQQDALVFDARGESS